MVRLGIVLMSLMGAGCSVSQPPGPRHETVLLSVERNHRLNAFDLRAEDLPGTGKGWRVHQTRLHGGKQEGVHLITVDNGVLQMVIIPTRGMSVLSVRCRDVRLGWDSPVEEVVHPRHIHLESRAGLGWLEGFNEWLVRCGLEFAGHPGKDEFINNVGDKAEMMLTLHGRVGNTPASEVTVSVDPAPPHRIRVRGRVVERQFYGPKLELQTEISMVPGEATFRISDEVVNGGAFDQEFQVIYHANFGAPILEEGARAMAPVKRIAPMNAHAAKGLKGFETYAGPTKGFIEQVYLIEPFADSMGRTRAMLSNAAGDRGASVVWSLKELPYLTVWKNTAAREDGYVTGLEPGTGYPYNRSVERRFGRVPKLAPGASRRFTLDFEVHRTPSEVREARKKVEGLQAGRAPEVSTIPPNAPK